MYFFRNRKLAVKLGLLLGIVLLCCIGALIAFNTKSIYDKSLQYGETVAGQAANRATNEFMTDINQVKNTLDTMSTTLLDAAQNGSLNREEVVRLLEQYLKKDEKVFGFYTGWEPNAFDGNDAEHINKKEYDDATGRFVPYVIRDGNSCILSLCLLMREEVKQVLTISSQRKPNPSIGPSLLPIRLVVKKHCSFRLSSLY